MQSILTPLEDHERELIVVVWENVWLQQNNALVGEERAKASPGVLKSGNELKELQDSAKSGIG